MRYAYITRFLHLQPNASIQSLFAVTCLDVGCCVVHFRACLIRMTLMTAWSGAHPLMTAALLTMRILKIQHLDFWRKREFFIFNFISYMLMDNYCMGDGENHCSDSNLGFKWVPGCPWMWGSPVVENISAQAVKPSRPENMIRAYIGFSSL